MNKAELRTALRHLRINKQNHYLRVLTAAADKERCMKRYNVVDQKNQLSTASKYAKYAKSAEIHI